MNTTGKILWRGIAVCVGISIFLLLVNFAVLCGWSYSSGQNERTKYIVRMASEAVTLSESGYQIEAETANLLDEKNIWVMMLDHSGTLQWQRHLPDELPRTYTISDVAKFARYYLEDYPVYTQVREDGLLVIGYPKDSIWKYQIEYPIHTLQSIPYWLAVGLAVNIMLSLVLSLIAGIVFSKSLRPFVDGIYKLGRGERVTLKDRGVFSSISKSVNEASGRLQDKEQALQKRDEARKEWISGISHDIRTPLSMILGYAGQMEEEPNENIQEKAKCILAQGVKIKDLVSDLNLVSRLEYHMQPIETEKIRAGKVVRRAVTDVLNGGIADKYQIEVEVPNELQAVQIEGNVSLLNRMIINLLHNSIRHNPNGCHIRVTLRKQEGMLFLSVRDDGVGICQEKLQKIQGGQLQVGEHGLGLVMVQRIAKVHGGGVTFQSRNGFSAEIYFPIKVE